MRQGCAGIALMSPVNSDRFALAEKTSGLEPAP